jgi:hypothetical protein
MKVVCIIFIERPKSFKLLFKIKGLRNVEPEMSIIVMYNLQLNEYHTISYIGPIIKIYMFLC